MDVPDLPIATQQQPARPPRPAVPRRALFGATVALWSAAWLLLTARALADGAPHPAAGAAVRAVAVIVGGLMCYGLHLILSRLPLRRFGHRMLVGAVLAAVAADIFGWITVGLSWLAFGRSAPTSTGMIIFILGFYTWVFFSWITAYLALSYSAQAHDAEQRAGAATAAAASAQLAALRYQLNPHFLFNTLNSLSALILERRVADAEQMVVRLSRFLRASLATDPLVMIRTADEVETQRRYLEIEQARFPDLALSTVVDPEIADVPVPPLILQPLVENAVKFAVAGAPGGATIGVSARRVGSRLELAVIDEGLPAAAARKGTGLGLQNVRNRLHTIYGDAAALAIEPARGRGFVARITLPLEA